MIFGYGLRFSKLLVRVCHTVFPQILNLEIVASSISGLPLDGKPDRFSCRRFKRFSQSKYGRLPIDLPVRFAKRVVRDDGSGN